jgi:hypothetical protein
VPEAVRGGGIDPVDAQLKGALDRSNEILVLLWSPTAASGSPSAEADAGDLQTGVS